jgi:5-methylcytosine-specific restriction endonuclease McrA
MMRQLSQEQIEKRRASQRKYQAKWQKAHPEYMREYMTKWNAAHPADARERHRRWREAHPEKARAERAAYEAAHPGWHQAAKAKRRALLKGATVGDRTAVRARYQQARENKKVRCYLCGKWIPLGERHVDHVHPVTKTGPTIGWNLAIVHAHCNLKKGAKMPAELGLLL